MKEPNASPPQPPNVDAVDEDRTGEMLQKPRWVAQSLDWKPGHDLGRYVILLTLGRGGMGVVFRAYDKELDRAVALKVLHGSDEGDASAALLREAQAMARLAHPNVVTLHDVVVLEKRVCVVMELVDGTTVRQWLKEAPRIWKEIISVFAAAAEGLAAAHDAKLIHRDFKPDNVLVGNDGRIRVTDFGIARLAVEDADTRTPADASGDTARPADDANTASASEGTHGPLLSSKSHLNSPATQQGLVVGTPRYMAPEHFTSGRADFRSDQYSLAISVYEALYGAHPFGGEDFYERLKNAQADLLRPPPPSSKVPQWVHRVLARALAADPMRRFASIRDLRDALLRDPTQRRNRLLVSAGVGAALVLASTAAINSSRARAQLCTGSERKLVGIWDQDRQDAARAAFVATALPFAEDSFSRAQAALDAYASEWVTTHRQACEATSVRGEQSSEVLTLRMSCLQQRLDHVAAVTELFARADETIVRNSRRSVDELPRLSTCSDVSRLSARLPPPEDPAVAAEVERIRQVLARVEALLAAGKFADAEVIARVALADAEKTRYSPLQTEAELSLAAAISVQGGFEAADRLSMSAFSRALADANDEALVRGALRLAQSAFRQHQPARALEWATFAESANERVKDAAATVLVWNARGNVARDESNFTQAAELYRRAVEAAIQGRLGADHSTSLGVRYNYASALRNLGQLSAAHKGLSDVIASARRVLGPRHPFLSYPLTSLGAAEVSLRRFDEANAHFEEVVALTGGKGINANNAFFGLAEVATKRGNHEEALRLLDRALEIEEALWPGGPEVLWTLAARADVFRAQGKLAAAASLYDTVLLRAENVELAGDAAAVARLGKAKLLQNKGLASQALPLAERALAHLSRAGGESNLQTLEARTLIAELRWTLGQRAEAVKEAETILTAARAELGYDDPLSQRARVLLSRATTPPAEP